MVSQSFSCAESGDFSNRRYNRQCSSISSDISVFEAEETDVNHNKITRFQCDADETLSGARCCLSKQRRRSSVTSWAVRSDEFLKKTQNPSIPLVEEGRKSTKTLSRNTPGFHCHHPKDIHLTVGLCRDYVCNRLKQSGFVSKVYVTKYAPARDQALSQSISSLGQSFESSYPSVYKNLSKSIGCVFDSAHVIRRLYFRLAAHVTGFDYKDFTWGRVLSLFSLAGALALDCVLQGHSDFVEEVIKISSDYMKENVLEWILRHGGWKGMSDHFNPPPPVKNINSFAKESKYFVTTLGILVMSLLSTFAIRFFM